MRVSTLILCIFSSRILSEVINKPYYNLNEAELLFRSFIVNYNKRYETKLEEIMRLDFFKNTLKEINFLNSVNRDAVFDINEFSDLSKEEFALTRTGFKKHRARQWELAEPPCIMYWDENITTTFAPASFDWRSLHKVTEVRNQGKCGSCWAFSLVGNIESQFAILTNILIQFSTQQLVDCVFTSEGCNGGDNVRSARTLISYGGIELESDYPYKAYDQNCTFEASKRRAKVVGCLNFDLNDENKLKEVLFKTGPLSIVVDAQMLNTYSGGVIDYCPRHEENHAVLLVGYGTDGDKDFWAIKNSWGEKWGEKGYFRLKRGIDACGLLNDKVVSSVIQI